MASKNTKPTGIDKEKLKPKDRTEKLATKLFPKETYNAYSENIKIAEGRKPINKQQRETLAKEIEMAEIASMFGHYSILLPEKSKGKNCDTVMDGVLTEFKNITGNKNSVGHRFRESLHQGVNSFLKIDSDISRKEIRNALRGALSDHKELKGIVYVYITKENKMYKWEYDSLK